MALLRLGICIFLKVEVGVVVR